MQNKTGHLTIIKNFKCHSENSQKYTKHVFKLPPSEL